MKKPFLIAGMSLLCLYAKAQKLEKPIIDKIKGDTTWATSEERIFTKMGFGDSDILYIYTQKIGDTYTLCFKIDRNNGINVYTISPENITNIKFTDGSVLDLQPTASGPSEVNFHSHGSRSFGLIFYGLTKDQLKELQSKTISVVRINSSRGNFDYEIKPKNADLVKKSLDIITTK